jgi:hypothetical protein
VELHRALGNHGQKLGPIGLGNHRAIKLAHFIGPLLRGRNVFELGPQLFLMGRLLNFLEGGREL